MTEKENTIKIVSRFIFDEAEKFNVSADLITMSIDMSDEDEGYADIVISDFDWDELARYRIKI